MRRSARHAATNTARAAEQEGADPADAAEGQRTPLATRIWRLGGDWWAAAIVCAATTVTFFVLFAAAADVEIRRSDGSAYSLADVLKDGADVALKLGAVAAGVLGIYRYWYRRYEPLVYSTSCGTPDRPLLDELRLAHDLPNRQGPRPPTGSDREAQEWHNLPIVVLHSGTMMLLKLTDGSQVDLEFKTPDGQHIWAVAYAYTLPRPWDEAQLPIRVSKSLRELFGMERDFPADLPRTTGRSRTEPDAVPPGWHPVEVNRADYYSLSHATEDGKRLIWLALDHYCVWFRDRADASRTFATDDFDAERSRIMEYAGISLRIYRRNALRYRLGE